MKRFPALLSSALLCLLLAVSGARAAEKHLASPDGALSVAVSDDHGLHYRVVVDVKAVVPLSLLPAGGFAGIISKVDF
jgi:hypothetical protein